MIRSDPGNGARHAKGKDVPQPAPGLTKDAGTLIGEAAARELTKLALPFLQQHISALLPVLAQVVRDGVAAAMGSATVRTTGESCVTCLIQRSAWDAAHAQDLRDALNGAMAAAGIESDKDPRLASLDLSEWLPPAMRQGGPDQPPVVYDRAVTFGGTGYCYAHLLAHPGVASSQPVAPHPPQPGQIRRPLLVPPPGMSAHAAAKAAQADPSLPGVPEQAAAAMRG